MPLLVRGEDHHSSHRADRLGTVPARLDAWHWNEQHARVRVLSMTQDRGEHPRFVPTRPLGGSPHRVPQHASNDHPAARGVKSAEVARFRAHQGEGGDVRQPWLILSRISCHGESR
jgi:hypothetical protein